MTAKNRFSLCAAVLSGMAPVLFFLAGCNMPPIQEWSKELFHEKPESSEPGPWAYKYFVVRTTPLSSQPPAWVLFNHICWNAATQKIETGKGLGLMGYETHDPVTEPKYQILKDFLLLPGIEEVAETGGDTISVDADGKIEHIYKIGTTKDLEIKIGFGHGTTPGTGELDPSFFGPELELACANDFYPPTHKGKLSVTGDPSLMSGTLLTLRAPTTVAGANRTYLIYGIPLITYPGSDRLYLIP
jgi:hypothetical protein